MMELFPFEKIIEWYKKNGRTWLPWRNYAGFGEKELWYRVWLSEIILQQTQASRWIDYFNAIIKAFPTIENLAITPYEEFFEYYKWLGYYSRAKNMLKTAQIIVSDYKWIFPQESHELIALPWVWPYTAEAIRAFAYQKQTLSIDTNLLKVFSRYYHGSKTITLTKSELAKVQTQFRGTLLSPRDINNALMDFSHHYNSLFKQGRKGTQTSLLESNNNTDIETYPLKSCKYFCTKWSLEIIKKSDKQKSFPVNNAHILIILHENHHVYFSNNLDNYTPFIITHSPDQLSQREHSKKYFKTKYNLDISVRPLHIKEYFNTKPYIVCYAQIQKWVQSFAEFTTITKKDINNNISDYLSSFFTGS